MLIELNLSIADAEAWIASKASLLNLALVVIAYPRDVEIYNSVAHNAIFVKSQGIGH